MHAMNQNFEIKFVNQLRKEEVIHINTYTTNAQNQGIEKLPSRVERLKTMMEWKAKLLKMMLNLELKTSMLERTKLLMSEIQLRQLFENNNDGKRCD